MKYEKEWELLFRSVSGQPLTDQEEAALKAWLALPEGVALEREVFDENGIFTQ